MAAANTALPTDSSHCPTTLSSRFLRQDLYNWWLIKAETGDGSKQLGVAGFTYTEGNDARVFYSTVIAERHDTVTLQAADGITILLSGFINRSRTLLNGFSSEVCRQFLLGFPYNWEELAAVSFRNLTNENAACNISGFSESIKVSADSNSSAIMSFDHLPAYILRDILMSGIDESEGMFKKSILDEIMHTYSNKSFNAGEGSCLNQTSSSQGTTGDLSLDEASSQKKAKANQKLKDSCHLLDGKSGNEEFQKASPEGIPRNSVLGRIMHVSVGETSCLIQKSNDQGTSRGPSLEETPGEKNKAASTLRKEDENHVPDARCIKEVFQKSNHKSESGIDMNSLSSGPLTRGKASLYKKTTVKQKQEKRRCMSTAESGQGDFRIVNDKTTSGPLTRSKARNKY